MIINEKQEFLLNEKLKLYKGSITETQVIHAAMQITMLTQTLEEMGYDPSYEGCVQLVDCIPTEERDRYSDSIVEAAIEYLNGGI